MGGKIINFTGKPMSGAISSIIHPKSVPCYQATKVYFNLADAECGLALGYKKLGVTVEVVGAKPKKVAPKKSKQVDAKEQA